MKKLISVTLLMLTLNSFGFIPIKESRYLDSTFKKKYSIYSPLKGHIHLRNHFINNLYKYGNKEDKAVQLVRLFFTELPGGEITFSHKGSNPAAHFSPQIIGSIFKVLDSFINKDNLDLEREELQEICDHIKVIISNDSDYNKSVLGTLKFLELPQKEFNNFLIDYERGQKIRKEADQFFNTNIVPLNRKIKKLAKNYKKLPLDLNTKQNLENEINGLKQNLEELKQQHEKMSTRIITNAKFKEAKRKFQYLDDTYNTKSEKYNLAIDHLIKLIIDSYLQYDLLVKEESYLPLHSTKNILLAYLWEKYESKNELKGYYKNIPSKFLTKEILDNDKTWNSSYTDKRLKDLRNLFFIKGIYTTTSKWINNKFNDVFMLLQDAPTNKSFPPMVPFSYARWMLYNPPPNGFPDCGENAIRNFFNHLLYNPKLDKYDYTVLEKIKLDPVFTELNSKLINYYKKYSNPYSQTLQEAYDWIEVLSRLNLPNEIKDGSGIYYGKGPRQTHVKSPYANMRKAINRIIGIMNFNEDHISEFVDKVSNLTGNPYKYDDSKIDKEGFGSVFLVSDDIKFKIKSNKPVHFDCYQFINSKDQTGLKNRAKILSVSKKRYTKSTGLLKYHSYLLTTLLCNNKKCFQENNFYKSLPLHTQFFYYDLDSKEAKEEASEWINELKDQTGSEIISDYLEGLNQSLSNR